MKKLFVLIAVIIVALYMSIFTVENNQVAMKTNQYNGRTTMYSKGLYFYIPMLDVIKYFDTSTKTDVFVTKLKLYPFQSKPIDIQQGSNTDDYIASFMVSWHISSPMKYYTRYQESGLHEINLLIKIKQDAKTIIEAAIRENQTVDRFNLLNNLLSKPIYMDKFGISIDNISLLQLMSNVSVLESNTIQNESPTDTLGVMDKKQIESAYYMAHAIIADTTLKKARLYQSIESTDEKFYNYYRKLEIYKNKAKSPEDFPGFNKLYQ